MAETVKLFSDERAASLIIALREGKTPKAAGLKMRRVEAYCLANPTYAAEALPLVTANMVAMHQEKLDRLARIGHTSSLFIGPPTRSN
jgi:hypothetical protein